jgi:hypothetical protein
MALNGRWTLHILASETIRSPMFTIGVCTSVYSSMTCVSHGVVSITYHHHSMQWCVVLMSCRTAVDRGGRSISYNRRSLAPTTKCVGRCGHQAMIFLRCIVESNRHESDRATTDVPTIRRRARGCGWVGWSNEITIEHEATTKSHCKFVVIATRGL